VSLSKVPSAPSVSGSMSSVRNSSRCRDLGRALMKG